MTPAPIRWLAGIPFVALLLVTTPSIGAAQPPCGDTQQNQWLSACALALNAADRREDPPPTDSRKVHSSAFESAAPLADHFVAACEELMREPWRIAERDRSSLAGFRWPPLQSACTVAQHLAWLRACGADGKAIEGRSRRELLVVFEEEGGFTPLDQQNYIHRRCSALKVHVTFRLGGDSLARADSLEDVVLQATPYIDPYLVFD